MSPGRVPALELATKPPAMSGPSQVKARPALQGFAETVAQSLALRVPPARGAAPSPPLPCPCPFPSPRPAPDGRATHDVRARLAAPAAQGKRLQDPLDPLARRAAHLALPLTLQPPPMPPPPEAPVQARAQASLEDVLPELVRRVAWSGDGKRGAVRLELAAGPLQGATLLVRCEDGVVRVELDAPTGVDAAGWRGRIAERLSKRGLQVESVIVR
jgi:hypothetical protein